MQFPESWLREFCDPPLNTDQLAELLTMSGTEVEDQRTVAPPFSGVVVGRIVSAEPHPQADRLRVCRVDAGSHSPQGPLQIVCGAPNARVGLLAPLALVGAELPPAADGQPLQIRLGLLRGVESQGMLCSARELGIADEHQGLLELADAAPVGADLRQWLKLDDTLFTLKLTPNLGHALSVYGIARELSALTGAPLRRLDFAPVAPAHDERLKVRVAAPDLCGRFAGRVIRGVNPRATTPTWMVERLQRCGQRSVSALVDISNYVMFELGRPSHIFDRDKIHGELSVRWARTGESLELLNGSTVALDDQVGVIADEKAVESLAGIMGGASTAVSDSTTNVYAEAAFWWPDSVAGRSRRFGFTTDAGHRFERGVDPSSTVQHLERITSLILEICGGAAGPIDDQVLNVPTPKPVSLRVARAAKVIGLPISQQDCETVFQRLGFDFTVTDGVLSVQPPSWRFDLTIEEDLIEEVIRVMGYEKLPTTAPHGPIRARVRPEQQRSGNTARRLLAALGYQEIISFSFVEERWERELAGNSNPIRVLNPIAAPLAVMRSSLIGSLVEALSRNLSRKASRVRLFELARVFRRDETVLDGPFSVKGVAQPLRLAGLAYGPAAQTQWGMPERPVDFFDVKGDVEALLAPRVPHFAAEEHPAFHPGRSARVDVDGQVLGYIGELHPRWRQGYGLPQAPVMFELDLDVVLRSPVPVLQPVARQQRVERDVALVLADDIAHDKVHRALMADGSGLIRGATLFDVYRPVSQPEGEARGERSLAYRLELLDDKATLTDAQIDAAVAAAVARVVEQFGARLRA